MSGGGTDTVVRKRRIQTYSTTFFRRVNIRRRFFWRIDVWRTTWRRFLCCFDNNFWRQFSLGFFPATLGHHDAIFRVHNKFALSDFHSYGAHVIHSLLRGNRTGYEVEEYVVYVFLFTAQEVVSIFKAIKLFFSFHSWIFRPDTRTVGPLQDSEEDILPQLLRNNDLVYNCMTTVQLKTNYFELRFKD